MLAVVRQSGVQQYLKYPRPHGLAAEPKGVRPRNTSPLPSGTMRMSARGLFRSLVRAVGLSSRTSHIGILLYCRSDRALEIEKRMSRVQTRFAMRVPLRTAGVIEWVESNVLHCHVDRSEIRKAKRLEGVYHVFVLPSEFEREFIAITKACLYAQQQGALVTNISLQAPRSQRYDRWDPVVIATQFLARSGVTVVVAAGNYGHLGMNPWARSPWVISVGAASVDGKSVAESSGRGRAGKNGYHPTLVAPGIDIIGPWPSGRVKEPDRAARDARIITPPNVHAQLGPSVKVDDAFVVSHTVESGTSQATAVITGLCAKILTIRRSLNLDTSPETIEAILLEAAEPMPDYPREAAGGGFLDVRRLLTYFREIDSTTRSSPYWQHSRALVDTLLQSQSPLIMPLKAVRS